MWETLRNAWKIQDLRKKILYTVGMLLVYRLLCYVPTPGVDLQAVSTAMSNYSDLLTRLPVQTSQTTPSWRWV